MERRARHTCPGRAPRVLAALLVLLGAAAQGRAGGVGDIVARHGIRPVEPATAAADFSLPALDGSTGALSDYHGSWVLLTFFATWCGPCRSEMPSLERLHREHSDAGLAVVAVSTDGSQSVVEPFVRNLGLTFPVLWDRGGQVAAAYRASSIPLSYLVGPDGRIHGVARGARDWAGISGMFDELLAAVPPDPSADRAYAAAAGPVELPVSVEPPSAEVMVPDPPPVAGEPFELRVRLHWAGSFDEYLPQRPLVHLPDGVEQEAMTAESSSADGRSVVDYTATLRASAPGRYELDPVELRYTPRLESEVLTARLLGPTVEVRPRTVAGLAPAVAAALGAALLAVVVGGAGLAWWRVRRRPADRSGDRQDVERLHARFAEARALRLDGDAAGFVLAMAELDREMGPAEADPAVPAAVLEQVRYGGKVPPVEELDRVQRRVERRLGVLRADPDAVQREAIRYAPDDEADRGPGDRDSDHERERR